MNPAEFVSLAVKLSNGRQEAELRTAVSRAYYGTFHSARELLEECGIAFPPNELFGADVHRKVRFCLANTGNADVTLVSNRLNYLRRRRNIADYDLKSDQFNAANQKNAKAAILAAIEIVDALQRCRTADTFGDIRKIVRGYARDVLRLPLDHE